MLKKNIYLLFCNFILIANSAFSQENSIVSVNPYTGTANVTIPIYTMRRGAVTLPITLSYNATGVKVKDVEDNAGMGWHLSAGGRITRKVMGLPDDFKSNPPGGTPLGWLYNSNATKITNFSITNTGTCTTEAADTTYIHTNFGDLSDTEPDIFYVTAPGLSCQFVFDGSHNIKIIQQQDLSITYTTDIFGNIDAFTIVNDMGTKYAFTIPETINRTTETSTPNSINYFKTDYNQYKSGVVYNGAWELTGIYDSNGNGIFFNYLTGDPQYSTTPLKLIVGGSGGTTSMAYQYTVSEKNNAPHYLSEIGSGKDNQRITFSVSNSGSDQGTISSIQLPGRVVGFSQDKLSTYNGYTRSFLTSIYGMPTDYKFSYTGYTAGTNILPDSTTKQIDYWGYYSNTTANTALTPSLYINPSTSSLQRYKVQSSATAGTAYTYALSGAARAADPANVMAGTLSQITYNSSGTTTLTYEPNDFYDPSTSTVIKGGGSKDKKDRRL